MISSAALPPLRWLVLAQTQNTMYAEGYDYVPHYSAMSGQIVGSLPVGIETLLDRSESPCIAAEGSCGLRETS